MSWINNEKILSCWTISRFRIGNGNVNSPKINWCEKRTVINGELSGRKFFDAISAIERRRKKMSIKRNKSFFECQHPPKFQVYIENIPTTRKYRLEFLNRRQNGNESNISTFHKQHKLHPPSLSFFASFIIYFLIWILHKLMTTSFPLHFSALNSAKHLLIFRCLPSSLILVEQT